MKYKEGKVLPDIFPAPLINDTLALPVNVEKVDR